MPNWHRFRPWKGPKKDRFNLLARCAHVTLPIGRHLYIFNGYTEKDGQTVTFTDVAPITRYDPLTHRASLIPLDWDHSNLMHHAVTQMHLILSGSAGATGAIKSSTIKHPDSSRVEMMNIKLVNVYLFGGYSLAYGYHTNILQCIQIPLLSELDSFSQSELPISSSPHPSSLTFKQMPKPCCQILSGNGLLSNLSTGRQNDWANLKAVCLLAVGGHLNYCRFTSSSDQLQVISRARISNLLEPSPRDKHSLEYWNDQLFVFGGYGPNPRPLFGFPLSLLHWPYLYRQEKPTLSGSEPFEDYRIDVDVEEWIPDSDGRGWNNQLCVYDLTNGVWRLPITRGASPPAARAAHQSAILASRALMFIFGGRSGLRPCQNSHSDPLPQAAGLHDTNDISCNPGQLQEDVGDSISHLGRRNDLYCLDLELLEWTRVRTPLDDFGLVGGPGLEPTGWWPCGRSWNGFTIVSDAVCSPSSQESCRAGRDKDLLPLHLFIHGGRSNSDAALSDSYVLGIRECPRHSVSKETWQPKPVLEARVMCRAVHRDELLLGLEQEDASDEAAWAAGLPGPPCFCYASSGPTPDTASVFSSTLLPFVKVRQPLVQYFSLPARPTSTDSSAEAVATSQLHYLIECLKLVSFSSEDAGSFLGPTDQVTEQMEFYHLAHLLSKVTLCILQFSAFAPCSCPTDLPTCDQQLLTSEYTRLQMDVNSAQNLITLSLLFSTLIDFMPPADLIYMLLAEHEVFYPDYESKDETVWLPAETLKRVCKQLTSDSDGHELRSGRDFRQALLVPGFSSRLTKYLPIDLLQIPGRYWLAMFWAGGPNNEELNEVTYYLRQSVTAALSSLSTRQLADVLADQPRISSGSGSPLVYDDPWSVDCPALFALREFGELALPDDQEEDDEEEEKAASADGADYEVLGGGAAARSGGAGTNSDARGSGSAVVDLLNPLASCPRRRFWHTATQASDGAIYVIGGLYTPDLQFASGRIERFRLAMPLRLEQSCLRGLAGQLVSWAHWRECAQARCLQAGADLSAAASDSGGPFGRGTSGIGASATTRRMKGLLRSAANLSSRSLSASVSSSNVLLQHAVYRHFIRSLSARSLLPSSCCQAKHVAGSNAKSSLVKPRICQMETDDQDPDSRIEDGGASRDNSLKSHLNAVLTDNLKWDLDLWCA